MGTNRRLLISIGSLLMLLTCIHAKDGTKLQENWDFVNQVYEDIDVENINITEIQQTVGNEDEDIQQQSDGSPSRVNIIASPSPVYRNLNPSHNQKICSTFGNHHFKTFDGDIFHFPGHCSYQFIRHCKSNYEEFFVGITRQVRKNVPVISGITMKIDGVDILLAEKTVTVNNEVVDKLPFSIGGTQVSKSGAYIIIATKIGFQMFWNEEDAITLELDQKYANQTCGLCGDYNGIPIYSEFIMNDAHLSDLQYGNLQKYHNSEEEKCEESNEIPETGETCPINKQLCKSVLTGVAFQECNKIVEVQKYIELCEQDICRCTGNSTGFCLCNIFTEYSRQCTHAGGKPKNWRTSKICPLRCAFNLQFNECGTSCPDTCTNLDRSLVCGDHCTDGCFCPSGLVFDDLKQTGCIPKEQCACTHFGDVYPSGTGYSEKCQDCTCQGGKWSCVKKACVGVCAIEGGSHITTYDFTRYNFHGDCTYTLSKTCDSSLFSVLAELSKCGQTDTETCLRGISLSLNGGKEFIFVKKCGSVYVNSVYTQLPFSTAAVTIFKPTSFYIIMQTNIGVQVKIQLVPTMQVYVSVDPKYMDKTCGLCGNFNYIQTDDFKSPAGVVEGTGSSFGNLWKTQLDCPNIKNNFEDPCALIGQNELYASHHCDLLLASDGPFASCHKTVTVKPYHENCKFDACNCDKKEDCMCSALSSYVTTCSRQGVDLRGWRTNTCHSYTATCPPGETYSYTVSTCMPSCRSLSEPDITCGYQIGIVDGCICEGGTYRDDNGDCVLPALCSCYYKGTAISPGEVFHENGAMCTCTNGKLECVGVNPVVQKVCQYPMVFFDCDTSTAGTKGSECQKSCSTFDTECYSSSCVSGCVCPEGLVLDDERNICITEDQCPCRLNDDYYAAGETVQVKCNTCTCKRKKWQCTTNTCLGTCAVYGDGHYLTFDNRRYRFNGNCWYTLAQDYCSNDASGTFRVFTENIPCGSQGTTCSKTIRLFLGNYELILGDQKFDVVKRNSGQYVPFKVRQMGIYLVVEAANGLALVWDKKTTIFIKLDPKFEGKVCGLCGNYDGNAANDYITRSQSVVGDVVEFGNSWKLSERCPNAVEIKDTCASNPYKKAWSQKQCSIITSGAFASCHGLVDPVKYYEACVNDACACDSGGDCDCFCTAVASYAQACSEAGECIRWRTPNICPVFCDFYNEQGHCEWHYKACGAPCLKTCMNPTGVCLNKLIGLEGCYPTCPEERPFFDEESMRCVASCNCYDEYGEEYKPGEKMPGLTTCSVCKCTENGRECTQAPACCKYEGKEFLPGDIVYYTADGTGGCFNAICSDNSTIQRTVGLCPTTTVPPTQFDFSPSRSSGEPSHTTPSTAYEGSSTSSGTPSGGKSTEQPIPSTSETPTSSTGDSNTSGEVPSVSPTACVEAHECTWSEWYDVSKPENNEGDFERFEDIENQGHKVCKNPRNVECRAKEYPQQALADLTQDVTCSRRNGLVCLNSKNPPLCYNYEIRIECCKYRECTTSPSPTSSTVELKTPSPTSKESPTSLPVESNSQTPLSTSSTSSGTSHPSDTETTSPELTSSEMTTPQEPVPSSSGPSSPAASATSPTTNCVYKMECRWTPWYDKNAPNTRSDGGETESVDDITSKGTQVCTKQEVENKIQCEAMDDKALPIEGNNQIFSCDLNDGLICKNRDQNKKEKCYNYQIRIECCQKVCLPIQTPQVTTTEMPEPETTVTQGITTASQQTSTRPPPSTPSTLSTEKPSIPTTSSEVPPSQTTLCVYKMECRWTQWFDNNEPSTKSDDGDIESIEDIKSKGIEVCNSREVEDKIECEAVDKIGVPIIDNSQKFSCNLEGGVNCKNREQVGKEKCYNYRIRVLCCEEICEPVPTPAISTSETSEPPIISSEATTQGTSTTSLPEMSTGVLPTGKPGNEITTPPEGTSPPLTSSSSEVTTSSTSTTTCSYKMECRWTPWYDINSPTQKSDGGDSESPEDIKSKGYEICTEQEVKHKIECEAIDNEGVTIANNQQILTCVLGNGLTCRNRDQKSKEKCHNYRIRVQCCASYCEPVVTSTTSSPVATQSSAPTTSSFTKPSLSSPKNCENERALECRWSQWFNENQPSTELTGEERENSDQLKSIGLEVCKQGEVENQIECKAQQYSEIASEQTQAQKTTCNVKDGLICKNQDQAEENCHDYSIRIECCSEKFAKSCGESTTPSSTEGTTVPTTTSVTKTSTLGSKTSSPSTSVSGTKLPGTSETSPGSSTEVIPSPSSTASEVTSATSLPTTDCIKKMECHWTLWYDNHAPNPKGDGGDTENAEDIKAKGFQICKQNEVEHNIECEAIDKEGETVSDNQQKMTCDLANGLSCLNKNQKKKEKCYNYKIRFECCAEYCEKVGTPTTALTTTTSVSEIETSSVESTPPSSLESLSTGDTSTRSPTSSTGVTSAPKTTSSTTNTEGASTPPATTTSCEKFRQSECHWTDWHNTENPSSDANGEDIENSGKLKSKGIDVCKNEEVENKIECKAAQYPDLNYKDIGQKSICNLKDGLVCKNTEQTGENKVCFDYAIRFECCSKKFVESCGKTTPSPTSPSSTQVTGNALTTSITEPPSQGPSGSTPGQPSPPGSSTSGETTTAEEPGSTSQSPGTSGETPPPKGTTPSQTSSPGSQTTGETPPPKDTTPSQTSSPGSQTTGETPPPKDTTPSQTSLPGSPTTGGTPPPKDPTTGQTLPPGSPTTGEPQPPADTTPGKTLPPGSPTTGGTPPPKDTTPGPTSPPGSPTTGEPQPPADTTPGETLPPGSPTTGGTPPPKDTTPGLTSHPGSPTTGGPQPPADTTPGETSPPGSPTTGGTSPPKDTTPDQTKPPGSPTTGGTPPPKDTTPGQTSPPGSPTTGEPQPPADTTPGETLPPGSSTTGGTPPPKDTTPDQTSPPGSPTTGGTPPPKDTTLGQTSPPGSPTTGEPQPTADTTPGEALPPSSSTTGGTSPPKDTTPGETLPPGSPTTGEPQPPIDTTPGETLPPGSSTTGGTPPPKDTTPGKTSPPGSATTGEPQPSANTTPGETSPPGSPTTGGTPPPKDTTPDQTSPPGSPTTGGTPPPKDTTPGQTSSPGSPTTGEPQPPTDTTPGQTLPPGSSTTGGTSPPKDTTPDQTSPPGSPTTGGTPPPKDTTLGQTSPPGSPTTGEPQPTADTTPGETSPPGSPTTGGTPLPKDTTPGETIPPGSPTTGEPQPPADTTPGETLPPGSSTTGGTPPPKDTTPGKTSPPGSATTGEPQPSANTTPGETSPPGSPTTGGTPPPKDTTPDQTSPPGSPTTDGTPPSKDTTPGQTSPPGSPTTGEPQPPTDTTPGETLPPGSSTTGGTSPPKDTTPGETSPPGSATTGEPQPSANTTPGETSPPGSPTTGGTPPPKDTTPDQTSPPGSPTTDGTPPPKDTTPGQTSPPGSPTTGEPQPPTDTTPGETLPPGSSTTGGTSPPKDTTPGETLPPGGPTTGEPQPPADTTPGETLPPGSPTTGGTPPPKDTTPGETLPPGGPTTGEPQPPADTTPGETLPPGSPTTGGTPPPKDTTPGKTSPPGSATTGEPQPSANTTPGETSPPGSPTTGGTPPPKDTTPDQTSPPGSPTTDGTPPPKDTTPGQTSPPGSPTTGEPQPPTDTTPGETLPPGSSTTGGTSPPKDTTPGETLPPGGPTTGEPQPPADTTPGETLLPGSPTTGGTPPPKDTTPGQTSTPGSPTSGDPSKPIGSTSAETPTSSSPHYPTTTSSCKVLRDKECHWTQWFNTEKPSSHISGEDKENSENLRSRGIEICKNEEIENDIECKPEKYPDSYQNVDQVMTCNVKDGLICKNKEQADEAKQCFDYAIRIECCSKKFVEECGKPTTTPTSTISSGTSSPVTESSATPSGSTEVLTTTLTPEETSLPTLIPGTTINCFCKVNDILYSPGETIYEEKDRQGCVFHAICSSTCQIERSLGECSTTEATPTTSENTHIMDVTITKPPLSRPSKKPTTGPNSNGTTYEPGTSTESKCGPCECLMPDCRTGYRVVSYMPPGACCAIITCEPDSVCVRDNTIYQPGSTIPQDKNTCQKCECSKDEQDESGFYAVKCQELLCDKTCEKGSVYAEKEGECCGECVPKQCTMKKEKVESGGNAESGQNEEGAESGKEDTHILIQIGDTYRPEGSTCSYYECDEEDGKPVLTKVKKVCQELDISKCEEGSVKSDEDGCCQTCTLKTEVKVVEKPVVENCSSRKNLTVLKEDDCEVEVELTYCGGPCMGTSMYSVESQGMDHKCTCCTELEVAQRQVEMLCANGQRRAHFYKDVVRCGCSEATCEPLTSVEIQESQQQQQRVQTVSRRRRR
ncbi:uncharacterized protein LOC142660181 [Rhinoderma darwinii]|uniref:uncharacterized protein LOC142660181 n=1 Tax=Rhinoderma darwinii TaxID=43563 RepID=UPI003F662993